MKQIYKFSFLYLSLFMCLNSLFAQEFEHKQEMNVDRMRSSSTFRRTVKMADLFNYPADIDLKNNISENSEISISFNSSNQTKLFFDNYYYTTYGGLYFYYNVPANVYGTDTLTIKIVYKGVSDSALLIVKTNPINCIDDSFTTDIGETVEAIVTNNDVPRSYFDFSTFQILDTPTFGSVEITGEGKIKYINDNTTPNYSIDKFTYRIADGDTNYDTATVSIEVHKDSYATKVFDFLPAPGQFVNTNIANSGAGVNVIGNTSSMISLGGFGGYVVVGFDQPIVNRPDNPYGVDFTVSGNAFGGWGEPSAVQVMKDENGNGLPDDTWYELAGSEYYFQASAKNLTMTYYNPKYNSRYTIPWSTDKGFNGAMRTNGFHQQPYYPDPTDFNISSDSVSYSGTLTKFVLDKSRQNYITAKRLPLFGYADSRAKNSTPTKPRNPYFDDANGKAADGFDLSWAVDAEGNPKELDEVHFVKVYSTTQEDGGWLGEVSPEIFSIAITTPDADYVPQDFEANAIGVPQLQVLKGTTLQYEGILFKNGIPQSAVPNWSSSNSSVATVDNTGLFTAKENGDTYLYFSGKDGVTSDSIQISVVELKEVVIELEGNAGGTNDTLKIIKGEIGYIHAEALDNRADGYNRFVYETYNWTSSDENIGTIKNGLFNAKNIGTTTIVAQSSHNPELSDTIVVSVNDVPQIKPKQDVVVIANDKFKGSFNVADLFVNEKGATIYLKSVSNSEFINTTLKNNEIFDYVVQSSAHGFCELTFTIEMYNQIQTVMVTFSIENPNYQKNILFVNGGQFMDPDHPTQLKSYLPASNTTKLIDGYIAGATSAQDMISDGNFAYVSADYYVTRYDIAKGLATDSVYTQDVSSTEGDGLGTVGAGVNHKMALYKNMLLVTRQFSSAEPQDGYNVRFYNKGDLSFINKIPVSNQATDIVVIGDNAYVMLNGGFAGSTSSIAVIDLKTLTLSREVNLGTAGLGVMQMQVKGNDIYCVRLADFMSRYNSGVVVFNTQTEIVTEYEYDANTSYDSSPLGIEPMTGDTLFVKKELGYVAFNTATKTFGTDIHFPVPKRLTQSADYSGKGSTYDPETKRYYIAYNYWHGDKGTGQIYSSNLDSIGTFDGVGASPEAVKVSNVYLNNMKPAERNPVTLYFKDSENIDITLPVDIFSDTEDGNVNYFLYNPANLPDGFTYNDQTRKLTGDLNNAVSDSTTFNFVMQGIDKYGDYALSTVEITVFPDNAPVIINPIADMMVDEDSDDKIISLDNVASDPDGDIIQYSLVSNSNGSIVSTNIIGKLLILDFVTDAYGAVEIVIMAEAGGQSVNDTFKIKVNNVDDPFMILNPVADVTVDEDAESTIISLENLTSNIDSGIITYSVADNSNESTVMASIAENILTLNYVEGKSGVAEIVILAEADGKSVTDTFMVTVNSVDKAPVISNPIADVLVDEDAENTIISLEDMATDEDNDIITYSLAANSNANLVLASISGNELSIHYVADASGAAEILVNAKANGKSVVDTFIVTVYSVDDAPVISTEIADFAVAKNSADTIINLTNVFTDVDNDDAAIIKLIKSNSNSTLVTTTIVGNELTLSFAAGESGEAEIVIEGDSNGLTVNETFVVTVTPISGTNNLTINDVVLYPNPSNGIFRIQTKLANTSSVRIYNMSGSLVYKNEHYANSEEIDISSQASGQYLVKLINGKSIITKPIIKK